MKKRIAFVALATLLSVFCVLVSCDFMNGEKCDHVPQDHYQIEGENHVLYCEKCHEELLCEKHEFVLDGKESYHNCDYEAEYGFSCECGMYIQKTVAAIGHDIVDGKCTRCEDGFYFELNEDGNSYKVVGYQPFEDNVKEVSVEIPATFKGLPVTAVGNYAFGYAKDYEIVAVTLPKSITVIGDGAFRNTKISEIVLPEGLAVIGSEAFSNTDNLKEAVIPDSVTEIGYYAFAQSGIKKLVLPSGEGDVTIGEGAFRYCKNIESLILTDSIISVGKEAFTDCTSVKELTLGKGLKTVGDKAFFNMESLEKLNYNSVNITSVGRDTMWGYIGYDYKNPPKKCAFYLGEGVESVATAMFVNEQFDKIHAPSIEAWFKLGEAPASEAHLNGPQPVGTEGIFINGEAIKEIIVPESVTTVKGHFKNCNEVTKIVIHDGVTSIDANVFSGLQNVEYVSIGSGVTHIGNYAFGELYNLKELYFNSREILFDGFYYAGAYTENGLKLYFGEKVESVSSYTYYYSGMSVAEARFASLDSWLAMNDMPTFRNAEGVTSQLYFGETSADEITSVIIPENVTQIGSNRFSGWNALERVTLHEGITEIGYRAFAYCPALTTVEGMGEKIVFQREVFVGANISNITIPDKATLFSHSFKGLNLESVVLGDGVYLDGYCFSGSTVKSLSFTGSEYNIQSNAVASFETGEDGIVLKVGKNFNIISVFADYMNVAEVDIDMDLAEFCATDFEQSLFTQGISQNKTIKLNGVAIEGELVIPDGVERIGKNVFCGAKDLTAVTLPASVKEIAESSFCDSGIVSVTFSEGLESIGAGSFRNTDIIEVTLPESLKAIGSCAFLDCEYIETVKGGSNVTSIGDHILSNYDVVEPVLYDGAYYRFGQLAGLESKDIVSIVIKEGTKYIPERFFDGCGNLLHVYVPAGCEIGSRAFINTNTNIRILLGDINAPSGRDWKILAEQNGQVIYIGGTVNVSGQSVQLGSIHYGISFDAESKYAYKYDQYITYPGVAVYGFFGGAETLEVPETLGGNTVTAIADKAFIGLTAKTAVLPDCVKKINQQAFYFCHELEAVNLPGVEVVEPLAFYDCPALTKVEMNSVTHLGSGAFYQCSSLASVTLPETIKYINNGAFQECTALESVTFADDSNSWYIYGSDGIILTVSDPEVNALNLRETYMAYGWIVDSEVN